MPAKKTAKKAAKMNATIKKMVGAQATPGEFKRAAAKVAKRFGESLESGPTVTKSGKSKGRNPHVGLSIPKETAAERRRRKAARKKKTGTVQAHKRRK